jgi:hypothetical protein
MGQQSRDFESELIDLTGCSLAELRSCDGWMLAESVNWLIRQIDRPRSNYGGGTGGPTRAD